MKSVVKNPISKKMRYINKITDTLYNLYKFKMRSGDHKKFNFRVSFPDRNWDFSNRTEPSQFCSNWFHAIIHSSKKNDFRGHPTVNFYYPEHTFNFHLILQSRLPIAPRWSQLFKSIARAQIVYLFSLQASIHICHFVLF